MAPRDDDLLARLNALKPSTVNLKSTPKASIDVEYSRPQTLEDRLAQRLKGLREGNAATGTISSGFQDDAASRLTSQVQDEVAAESNSLEDWQQDGNDQSIDDLLAELQSNDQARLDPDDPKDVAALLKEAKAALPPPGEEAESESIDRGTGLAQNDGRQSEPDMSEEAQAKHDDYQDDVEADDYVKKVLAELDIDRKYGDGNATDDDEGDERTDEEAGETREKSSLDLPSAPATLPSPEAPSYEDSELEARFSKLGLDLPSTPTTTPVSKAKVKATAKGKAKSKMPTYTDEDIDSWCCICNEDGEVRCLGCDGDIYCQNCWRDGHGTGPGQERGHKAVQYVRKRGGSMASAS